MKKGDVLFRIDPTPYQLEVDALEGEARQHAGQQPRARGAAHRRRRAGRRGALVDR